MTDLAHASTKCSRASAKKFSRALGKPVGFAKDVSDPGSYFASDIAGEPILVARGKDNMLRAISNVSGRYLNRDQKKRPAVVFEHAPKGITSCAFVEGILDFKRGMQ